VNGELDVTHSAGRSTCRRQKRCAYQLAECWEQDRITIYL